MTIQTILSGRSKRTLFDSLCNEFGQTSFDEKISTLKELHHFNLLDKTIKAYLEYHQEDYKAHVRNQLEPTLKKILSYSRFRNPNLFFAFQNLNLEETIEELKKEWGGENV